ncbi:hypothetical protein [uncultured Serratia sp.]|uniref:hypothetical protein n=1 Tax=uncultured Serratia sp. TaxID=239175 RepID=UPI0025830A2D|nr:hypothetical protein [uncultured Serratia sp.]
MQTIKLSNEITDPELFAHFIQSRASGALLEIDLLESKINTFRAKNILSKSAHEELCKFLTYRRQLHTSLPGKKAEGGDTCKP